MWIITYLNVDMWNNQRNRHRILCLVHQNKSFKDEQAKQYKLSYQANTFLFQYFREEYYKYYLSKSMWPSDVELPSFLHTYEHDINIYENFTDDPEFFRRNFLIIEVFYETLHLRNLEERPKYTVSIAEFIYLF